MKFWRQRKDEDLDAEIRSHLDEAIRDRIARGETPDEARAHALREFGNVGLVKEVTREMWGWAWLDQLGQDFRYSLRVLVKRPGFALATILVLGLGIGANTTIFSVVNALLFRPLPVRDADKLVRLFTNDHHAEFPHGLSYADYQDYQREETVFSELAITRTLPLAMNTGDKTTRANVLFVSGNYFSLLGVNALHGRMISSEHDQRDKANVAVLSHSCWLKRYGGDPAVVGKTVKLNSDPATIIGIAPESMGQLGLGFYEVFVPIQTLVESALVERDNHNFEILGRLKAGVTLALAHEAMQLSATRLAAAYPKTNHGVKIAVLPEIKARFGGFASLYLEPMASFALTLAGLALLVACANAANLMLARAATRQREFAIRAACGASRTRLVRLLLAESMLLAAASSVAGLLCAAWLTGWLTTNLDAEVQGLKLNMRIDGRVMAYTFAVALVTGLLTGLTQAWQASRPDLNRTLKLGGGFSAPHRQRLRNVLAVTQVAASVLLLVCAGLLGRSQEMMRKKDLGFRVENVLLLGLDRQGSQREVPRFWERLLEGAQTLPGVRAAALAERVPIGSASAREVYLDNQPERATIMAANNTVSPAYFSVMGIPLLRGRTFTTRDDASAPRVAIINEAMAEQLWSGESPLGKRFRLNPKSKSKPWEVVGVARNHPDLRLGEAARPAYYLPLAQDDQSALTLHLQTDMAPSSLSMAMQRLVRELDEDVVVHNVKTMSDHVYQNAILAPILVGAPLAGSLGLLSLLLVAVGLYGLLAQWVTQRTHEIGVRMALGAPRRTVLRLVIGQGLRLACAGVALGVIVTLAFTQVLKSVLFGVGASDPLVYGVVTLMLLLVAFLACGLPARRATRVDPLIALRHE